MRPLRIAATALLTALASLGQDAAAAPADTRKVEEARLLDRMAAARPLVEQRRAGQPKGRTWLKRMVQWYNWNNWNNWPNWYNQWDNEWRNY